MDGIQIIFLYLDGKGKSEMAETTTEDLKFQRIYRFVILVTCLVFLYIFLISFLPIDKENKDNIKTVLIFLLGYLSANGQYLTGGNPSTTKKTEPTVLNTGDAPQTTVNPTQDTLTV